MTNLIKLLSLFIVILISLTSCAPVTNEEFIELESLVETEFNISKDKQAYFKYKLGDIKGPIGIHFLLANLYTVEVSVLKKIDGEAKTYYLAKEEYKEIDTTDFEDYVYIIIKEKYEYFYKDYIIIYDPNKTIKLKSGEPLLIPKFFSNNKYEMTFNSQENSVLIYNTLNTTQNNRKITIKCENETIIDKGEENQYKTNLNKGECSIVVENFVTAENEEENLNQEFSIIAYEKKDLGFTELNENVIKKTKYIYSNKAQTFYYYADISKYKNSNSINFKLFPKYYFDKNIQFFTKIIYLDEKISETVLESNIPTENNLPNLYDDDSDEYFRIFFHDTKTDKQYKYLLVKVEITENEYYSGYKYLDVSIGNEVVNYDYTKIEYNRAQTVSPKIIDYIPTYFKLILNKDDKYLFTSQNEGLSIFFKGDLITEDNKPNEDYLNDSNEIVILSGIAELTIKLFGSTTADINFYIEKIKPSQLIYVDTTRKNDIFEIKMTEDECKNDGKKYVLGTFDYEEYAYGQLKMKYYATVDEGEFEIYYKNFTSVEDGTLFPIKQNQVKEINKIILFETNVDLFTIKCKKAGNLSIRPVSKTFEENVNLVPENNIKQISLYDSSEIIQLSTPLGLNKGKVYFSILSLDGIELTISPNTLGLFEEKKIKNNELFAIDVDLSKYKMDQLAIKVVGSSGEKNIEVVEIIHNEFNTYQKLEEGDNQKIKLNNVFMLIDKDIKKINVTIENLQNKNISYGVIKSAINDSNYLATANNYPNITSEELKENNKKFEIENIYNGNNDSMKPFIYLVISVLGEEKNLEYNVNVQINKNNDEEKEKGKEKEKEKEDGNTMKTVLICLVCAIVLIIIIVAVFIFIKKNRNKSNDLENVINDSDQKLLMPQN